MLEQHDLHIIALYLFSILFAMWVKTEKGVGMNGNQELSQRWLRDLIAVIFIKHYSKDNIFVCKINSNVAQHIILMTEDR